MMRITKIAVSQIRDLFMIPPLPYHTGHNFVR
jgi:hypothetical protein